MFSGLFKSKIKDLAVLEADMHSHLIPGIDDGAKTLEDSIKLIFGLKELGFKHFITTPHVMADYYNNSSDKILRGIDEVRKGLAQAELDVTIQGSAEYYMDENFADLIKKNDLLPFGDNYILFETGFDNKPYNMEGTIFDLKLKGYKPILAHPERYRYMHQDFEAYQRLFEYEVDLQLNLGSLAGAYGPQEQKIAEKLIKKEMVSFIGTDTHRMSHVKLFPKTFKNKYLKQLIESGKLKNKELVG